VINDKFWQALSPADQKVVADAVAEGIAWNNQEIKAREGGLVDKFKKAGMEVITPDIESFRKPVLDSLPKMFEAKWGKGLFEKIVETR
jgi:TRAP-type C4-dicarboxylate transport system substrate-binding protein